MEAVDSSIRVGDTGQYLETLKGAFDG